MAEEKILISIQINDKDAKKGADGAVKSLSRLERAQKELNYQLSEEGKELARVKAATNDQILANNLAAKSAVNMAKGIKQSRAQSGLNNAILLETSRLASDAGYGFTAIANNLSQVITLFSSFTKTAGGVGNSLKELGKSLIGSGGFLIAIQLLIAFGPQIFAFFERLLGFTREMREAFEGAAKTVSDSAGSFEVYVRTLQDSTKSQEEQNDAIKALNKEFPEYVKQLKDADLSLKDVANQTKEATKITNQYREAILKQAMSRQAQIKIEESAAKIIEIQIEREAKARDKGYDSLLAAETRFTELSNKKTKQRLDYKEKAEFQRLKNIVNLNQDELEEENERIDSLIEFVDIEIKQDKKKAKSKRETNRIFKTADLDFEKETQQSRERLLKDFIKDEEAQINLKFNGIRERARLKQQEFEQDQKRRLDDFLKSNATEEQKADAVKRFDKEIAASKESLASYEVQLEGEKNSTIAKLRVQQAQKIQDIDRENQYKRNETLQREADQEILNEGIKARNLFDLRGEQLDKEQERLKLALDNENLTFNERVNLEKQLTDVEQEQSDRRIQIAELEAQAKRQTLEVTASALLAFGNLVGKETGAGKALAVAGTLISTYLSAQKAYESQFAPLALVDSPVRGAIAAAAAVASGLANVKAILSVKTPNDKSQGAAASRTIQAPSFNVVGASQTSQLAEAVATQEAKPVKAFVVGKDISTQQELDRNITRTASFG